MSFIERELQRIRSALGDRANPEYERLWAAQQALEWAQEPTGFKAPYAAITDTPQEPADCPTEYHPPQF